MATGGKGFTSQMFTSTTTWTVPAGVTQVILIGAGGGAGGAGGTRTILQDVPGGNGVVPSMKIISVVPNTTYTITIGAGGTGGTGTTGQYVTPPAGTAGGTTSFGVLATFPGATPSLVYHDTNTGINRYASGAPNFYTGLYATAIFGCNKASGTPGALSVGGGESQPFYGGGGGGAGLNGPGGNGGNGNTSGVASAGSAATSTNYGAGGGGGGCGSSSGANGGAGAGGFLQVVWVEA